MTKVIITGASGFIGQSVLDELLRRGGYEIYAVTSKAEKLVEYANRVNVCELNLLDENGSEEFIKSIKADRIIHLAWSLPSNNEFMESNANEVWRDLSVKLIRFFYESGGKRFVFAGTSAEYCSDDHPWKEDEASQAISKYGECKRSVANAGMNLAREYQGEFVTARFFSVYGKNDLRQGRAITGCISSLLDGERVVCLCPDNKWDYIFVDDAAALTVDILESSVTGAVNVASGKPVRMGDVFCRIAELMGCSHLIEMNDKDPKTTYLYADITLLQQVAKSRKMATLDEGLANTIAWYKRYRLGRGK